MQSVIVLLALVLSCSLPFLVLYSLYLSIEVYNFLQISQTVAGITSFLSVFLIFRTYAVLTWIPRLIFSDVCSFKEHLHDCFDPSNTID